MMGDYVLDNNVFYVFIMYYICCFIDLVNWWILLFNWVCLFYCLIYI